MFSTMLLVGALSSAEPDLLARAIVRIEFIAPHAGAWLVYNPKSTPIKAYATHQRETPWPSTIL